MTAYIRFEKDTRYYELHLGKNLFNEWSLSIINGRINSRLGRIRYEHFPTLVEAMTRMCNISKYRTEKRKYSIVKTHYFLYHRDDVINLKIQDPVNKDSLGNTLTFNYETIKLKSALNIANEIIARTNG